MVARQREGLVASERPFHRTFSDPIGGCHGKWQICRVGDKVRGGKGWERVGGRRNIETDHDGEGDACVRQNCRLKRQICTCS
jgi:hypothetical protein